MHALHFTVVCILQYSVFCTLHCGLFVFTVHFKRCIFVVVQFSLCTMHGVNGVQCTLYMVYMVCMDVLMCMVHDVHAESSPSLSPPWQPCHQLVPPHCV